MLHDLFEYVGTHQQVEDALLLDGSGLGLHVFLDPAAAFAIGDVHELDADGAGVDAAGFAGELAFDLQFRLRLRLEETERIEIGFEVSPVAEGVEHAFALEAGRLHEAGQNSWRRILRISRGHNSHY